MTTVTEAKENKTQKQMGPGQFIESHIFSAGRHDKVVNDSIVSWREKGYSVKSMVYDDHSLAILFEEVQ